MYRSRRPTVSTTGSRGTTESSSGASSFGSVPFGIVTTFPATPGKSLITRSRSASETQMTASAALNCRAPAGRYNRWRKARNGVWPVPW